MKFRTMPEATVWFMPTICLYHAVVARNELAFDSAAGEKAVGYFLDGQGWLFRNDAIETTSNGRAITRKGQTISAAPSQLRFASGRLQALGIRTSELDDLEARLTREHFNEFS